METARRPLTQDELSLIVKTMAEYREKDGTPITVYGQPAPVMRNLLTMSAEGQVVVFTDNGRFMGILVFDVGEWWWSDARVLMENFVLSVTEKPGFQREALKELNRLADEYDVDVIAAGSIFMNNSAMVMNGYKKDGFLMTTPTCVKIRKGGGQRA